MDWREVLEQTVALLLQAAIPAVAVWAVGKLSGLVDCAFAWAAERGFVVDESRRLSVKETLVEVVEAAVLETNQELVDGLKKEGKFDADTAREALHHARKKILERVRAKGLTYDMIREAGEKAAADAADALIERTLGKWKLPASVDPS